MGANSTQALGVTLFLIAFVIIAAAMAAGGSILLLVTGLAVLMGSAAVFMKAKPWENRES
jgi:hypothetical protein